MADVQSSAVGGACGFDSVSVVDQPFSDPVLVLLVGDMEFRLRASAAAALARQIQHKLSAADEVVQKRRAEEHAAAIAARKSELLQLGSDRSL